MDYIKSLLELIKSKKELSGDNAIKLSIFEIADAWNRQNILHDVVSPLSSYFSLTAGRKEGKSIDYNFVQDVVSVLKKFEEWQIIKIIGNLVEWEHPTNTTDGIISLDIIQPKFGEVYKEYEEKINKAAVVETISREGNGKKNSISRMDFDSQNGVIRCGNIKPYSFHKGAKGDRPLLKLFRKLWGERQYFLKGKEHKKGIPFSPEALAAQTDVTKEKLISMLKSISRILKTRKFPAEIERKNGILLVVTEK